MTTIFDSAMDAATTASIDAFLRDSPFAAYQQSRIWTEVVPRTGVQDYRIIAVLGDDGPVGAAVVRRTSLAPGAWLATMQRGPIVHQAHMLGPVLAAMTRALRDAGCCTVQLAPRVRGRDVPTMAEALRANGFSPLPERRQPLHSATGIVWLDKDEGAVLGGFKQRGRRQIKAAEKAGVTVRPVDGAQDVAAYQRVLDAFRASKPDYDMRGLPDAAGQARLIADLGGAMLLAELDGQVIGGHAFVRQGEEAIWLSLATSDDHPHIARSYPLLWKGMRIAREMGCVGYDLAGMPIVDAANAGEAGRMQFKTAFAPTKRIMPPMQVAALNPMKHAIFFGARQFYRGSGLAGRLSDLKALVRG